MPKWVEFECTSCGEVTEVFVKVEDDGEGGVEYIPVNMRNECMIDGYGSLECECGGDLERM